MSSMKVERDRLGRRATPPADRDARSATLAPALGGGQPTTSRRSSRDVRARGDEAVLELTLRHDASDAESLDLRVDPTPSSSGAVDELDPERSRGARARGARTSARVAEAQLDDERPANVELRRGPAA